MERLPAIIARIGAYGQRTAGRAKAPPPHDFRSVKAKIELPAPDGT